MALVPKTSVGNTTGGSNPSLSANASIAQMAVQRPRKAKAVSSNLTGGSMPVTFRKGQMIGIHLE